MAVVLKETSVMLGHINKISNFRQSTNSNFQMFKSKKNLTHIKNIDSVNAVHCCESKYGRGRSQAKITSGRVHYNSVKRGKSSY